MPGNENVVPFAANPGSLMVLEMPRAILREKWWPLVPATVHYSFLANRMTSQITACHSERSAAAKSGQGDHWTYPFPDAPVVRGKRFTSAFRGLRSGVRGLIERKP